MTRNRSPLDAETLQRVQRKVESAQAQLRAVLETLDKIEREDRMRDIAREESRRS
ncbi:MAG TPA: hypothetical protein PLH23_04945 [Hyphomonadaceae bacterium]|nr:hypothetical protein [Hyphomonadaceae bacterium]HPI47593.1 hypothetical protein [Hyphomonadaceae bacterium]